MLLVFCVFRVMAATSVTQQGVVMHVVDGDTLWVKTSSTQQPLKVRLLGIDAPEICQTGGAQAREALKSRVMGQSVTVTSRAHDDYGRTVGRVYVQGEDVGRWLVASGHAWVYSFRSKKPAYADELIQARGERRGLFNDAAFEEPRLFRKRHGSCQVKK